MSARRNSTCSSRRTPQIIRQRAIRQRFGEMQPADFFRAVEIGEGARNAQHVVIAARGQLHGLGRIAQQFLALAVRLRDSLQ